MAYVVGILHEEEIEELAKRGWEIEQAPKELIPEEALKDGSSVKYKMVWVDASMFNIMSGPDWDK